MVKIILEFIQFWNVRFNEYTRMKHFPPCLASFSDQPCLCFGIVWDKYIQPDRPYILNLQFFISFVNRLISIIEMTIVLSKWYTVEMTYQLATLDMSWFHRFFPITFQQFLRHHPLSLSRGQLLVQDQHLVI